jgi:hypothetical protein
MHSSALGVLISALLVSSAFAAPCVGTGYDVPLPGATNVETTQVDVPSAQFPGMWQRGLIEGFAYQIFADRTAVILEVGMLSSWSIAKDCQKLPCIRKVSGSPPRLAWDMSKLIELCIGPAIDASPSLASKPRAKSEPLKEQSLESVALEPAVREPPTVPKSATADSIKLAPLSKTEQALPQLSAIEDVPEKVGKPVADPAAVKLDAPMQLTANKSSTVKTGTSDVAGPTWATTAFPKSKSKESSMTVPPRIDEAKGTCSSPAPAVHLLGDCSDINVSGGDTVGALQRLLVQAGANPGKLDGVYGPATDRALLEVLGYAGRDLELSAAILAVEEYLCRP